MDGTSIWAGDGVHLTSNSSRVAARKLMADLARGGEEGEPANKRTRLESIVPTPVTAKKRCGSWAAAYVAAPTRPAAADSLALWPAPALTAWARIRPLQHYPEGR
jgi:hypothetical protein